MADIEATFGVLSGYRVTGLYRANGCEYLSYERGTLVTELGNPDCQIDVENQRVRVTFDGEARAALNEIYQTSDRHGFRLQSAFPQLGDDDSISGGTFGFHWCTSYIYDPGWVSLPEPPDDGTVTPVDADWYLIRCGSG